MFVDLFLGLIDKGAFPLLFELFLFEKLVDIGETFIELSDAIGEDDLDFVGFEDLFDFFFGALLMDVN